jgi:hypothetical protein
MRPRPPEEVLLERMRILYAQLENLHPHTPEYERLSAEIRELALAYDKLTEGKRGNDPPDTK